MVGLRLVIKYISAWHQPTMSIKRKTNCKNAGLLFRKNVCYALFGVILDVTW